MADAHDACVLSADLLLWYRFAAAENGDGHRAPTQRSPTQPDTSVVPGLVSSALASPAHDASLMERLRQDDATAIDEAIRLYAEGLIRFAARYVTAPDVIDDVVQETFATLWLRRQHITIRSSLRSYLFTAVRNRVLNLRRKATYEHAASALLAGESDAIDDPAAHVAEDARERATVARTVRAALASLPDRMRQAALLRWQEGLSRPEIAEVMGVSVATINSQLTVAARRLRLLLQEIRPPQSGSA